MFPCLMFPHVSKRLISLIPTVLIIVCSGFLLPGCNNGEKTGTDKLSAQAREIAAAFFSEDFEKVANFTSPLVLNVVGGKANLVEGLKRSVGAMKTQGMRFQAINFGQPSGIIRYNGQLQATIEQLTEIQYAGGTLKSSSLLVALSDDEGKTWKFIDTSGKDSATVRQTFPELSPELKFVTAIATRR